MYESEPVSVVVNVYNEAETIERELREIHAEIVAKLPGSELIVAEDGSTDGTKEILERLKTELGIIHSTASERKGYAKAFRDAVALAKNPFVFFSDTGGKLDFKEFWKLYAHRHEYDVLSGTRNERTDQWYRRLLTWSYNASLRAYFDVELRDADAGFRLYRTEVIRKISAEPWINKYLIASELALRAIYSGFTVKEIPIAYRQRAGSSRGLPLKTIPKAIVSVVRNFPRVRQAITVPGYRTGPAAPSAAVATSISRPTQVFLALLGVLALVLLLVNAWTMTISEDEANGFYLVQRSTPAMLRLLASNEVSEDPPLYDLIQHFWASWTGCHAGLLRMLPLTAWLAMLPGVYLVGRHLGGPRGAWFALAAVLLMPYHWIIPAMARWYSLYACAAVWNFLFLLHIVDGSEAAGRKRTLLWACLYVLSGAALWYTNYSAIVLFFAHLIVGLFRSRFRLDVVRTLVFCWVGIALLFLPWLPTFLRQLAVSTHAKSYWPIRTAVALYSLVAGEFSSPYHLAFLFPAVAVCVLLPFVVLPQLRRCWAPAVIAAIVLTAIVAAGAAGPKRLTLMSPFLAMAIGLALSSRPLGQGRWHTVVRCAFGLAVVGLLGGSATNAIRRSDWLSYRWLDPCQEAVESAQAQNPNAVVVTNSISVLFYLHDPFGDGFGQLTPDDLRRCQKEAVFLFPPRMQCLEPALATANEAVWIHHSNLAPISESYEEMLRTMEQKGYHVTKTETFLRASPEFIKHHPHFQGKPRGPLDEYRVISVYFAKTPSAVRTANRKHSAQEPPAH